MIRTTVDTDTHDQPIGPDLVAAYQRDGAVVLRGVLSKAQLQKLESKDKSAMWAVALQNAPA